MKIESFFPGRLRVNSPLFTKQENVDRILERIHSVDGVESIAPNLRTGSLVVRYDSSRITPVMLMKAKGEIERLEGEL
ncbi:MAG: hypothetical protein LBT97_05240 [Planctomycetota bacterium]|jgi:hypothetical protein|nr:hypothetical protein [Planctomycetota bacterium]